VDRIDRILMLGHDYHSILLCSNLALVDVLEYVQRWACKASTA
jgi:hypothetical protein